MASSNIQIPLKVLIHKEEKRVIFAEANSDFVDILFSFLTMPMGTIVRLLSKHPNSAEQPTIGSFNNLYKSIENLEAEYFASEACKDMLLNTRNSAERECQKLKINIDDNKSVDYYTCEDMDFFGSFKSSGITDFGVLEEKTFNIGSIEIIDLLRYSILSKTPLTRMFFCNKEIMINKSVQPVKCKMSTEGIISFFCFILHKISSNLQKMTVKVLVQKSSSKILLAQCSEDFINFLFNLLTLPLGNVISMLESDNSPALCAKNIHQSVSNLNVGEYIESQKMEDILLFPQLSMFNLFLKQQFHFKENSIHKFYCSSKVAYGKFFFYQLTTKYAGSHCELNLVSPVDEWGILRRPTKFMVTDDLVVTPLSSMSYVKYIQSSNVSPSDIEEQVIHIGRKEAFTLLREALMSTSVLTNSLKHLIRTKPDTKKLVRKPSGAEDLEVARKRLNIAQYLLVKTFVKLIFFAIVYSVEMTVKKIGVSCIEIGLKVLIHIADSDFVDILFHLDIAKFQLWHLARLYAYRSIANLEIKYFTTQPCEDVNLKAFYDELNAVYMQVQYREFGDSKRHQRLSSKKTLHIS
ncbi:uncharacterized protein LOC141689758 [Apium graveolens]|uniref:uncharacterized protein LOC141689758 n=1 Tax=Apium graveolens TaxID=4045 RepID=UPI003D7990D7